jgi:hypothetical protein
MLKEKFKQFASRNLIPEILFLSSTIIVFDIIFVMRFDFSIALSYWIIALFNVAFFVGLLTLIKSNKKRFRAIWFIIQHVYACLFPTQHFIISKVIFHQLLR